MSRWRATNFPPLRTTTVTVVAGETVTANFSLVSAPTELNPIVVTGYGELDRRRVTGAVASVTAEKLRDIPTENPMKALQGRVAGVEIVAANNEPGAAMNVRIRGIRSLTASNDPLYVVDGIPITGGIQDFNPQQIESIEVLKDASATAISRASRIVATPIVTASRGTLSSPKKSAAASFRVTVSSVTSRVRVAGPEPGSLKPMWPVRPMPRSCKSSPPTSAIICSYFSP